jgi:hypothetical protein
VVPAPVVVFVFGARRRCGTAAIRAPSIDADSIVADIIARPVCGSSSHVQIYLDIRKLHLKSADRFFFGEKPKEKKSKTRATGGRRLVAHRLE